MNLSVTLLSNLSFRIFNVVALLFITILLSRLMGAEGFGTLSLLITNITVFNLVSSFGTDSAINYHTAAKTLPESKITFWIFNIVLLQALVLLLILLATYFTGDSLSVLNDYKWLLFFYLAGVSLSEKYSALLNGKHLYVLVNKVLLVINFIFLALLVLFYFQKDAHDIPVYILLFVGFQFLQAVFMVFIYHIQNPGSFSLVFFNKEQIKIFFSYSLVAFITNCIQLLAYRMDFWLISFFRNEKELGWYALATRLTQFFWIASISYASIIVPYISSVKHQFEREKLVSLIRFMNLINLLLGIFVFGLVKWIIPFVFGVVYLPTVLPFQILLPGVLLFCITNILAAFFSGLNLLRINLVGSSICFLIILVLDLLLIPLYGIIGASIASSVGYAITTMYFVYIFCNRNKIPFADLFLVRRSDWQYALATIKQSLKIKQ